jgi:ATP-dependent helicase/nuclease subunit A
MDLNATIDAMVWGELEQRLSWSYPFTLATRQPAKTSVTVLRHQSLAEDESRPAGGPPRVPRRQASDGGSAPAADVGSAQHAFLRWVSLDQVGSVESLQNEAQRLVAAGALTPEAAALLEFKELAAFWQSDLGRNIRAHPEHLERELVFTARFTLPELADLAGQPPPVEGQDEYVVVQGVADLVVIRPEEIWLVDFKTDRAGELRAREYEVQLKLYGRALSRIYRRQVTQSWLYFLSTGEAVPITDVQ